LYKKDKKVLDRGKWWKRLLPWNFFSFLIRGPSEALISKYSSTKKQGDPIIRMIKAEEEALNVMGEEAGKQAYE
jgi:glutathione peroxidase-family protein